MFHPTSSLDGCGKTTLAPENFYGPHGWHNRSTFPKDVQEDRSGRPQRVKARGVPLWYVEGLNDARTKLADFFNSLLIQLPRDGVGLKAASCRKSAALTVFFDQLLRE